MNSRNEPDVLQKRVRNLEPGFVLARPVDADGRRLLPEETVLDSEDIRRLEDWKQRIVYVYAPEDLENDDSPYAQAS